MTTSSAIIQGKYILITDEATMRFIEENNCLMEIEDFVAQTLMSINSGMATAYSGDKGFKLKYDTGVHFDLAVVNTVSKESGGSGKAKLSIKVVDVGGEKTGSSTEALESTSRIQFTVIPQTTNTAQVRTGRQITRSYDGF